MTNSDDFYTDYDPDEQTMLVTQSLEALLIEYYDLAEKIGARNALSVFIRVILNIIVDRRFTSEEYEDLQNERMGHLETMINILIQSFQADPQTFVNQSGKLTATMLVKLPTGTLPLEVFRLSYSLLDKIPGQTIGITHS